MKFLGEQLNIRRGIKWLKLVLQCLAVIQVKYVQVQYSFWIYTMIFLTFYTHLLLFLCCALSCAVNLPCTSSLSKVIKFWSLVVSKYSLKIPSNLDNWASFTVAFEIPVCLDVHLRKALIYSEWILYMFVQEAVV